MSTVKRLLVSWADLKKMGWPYSRTHTMQRMMKSGRFPQARKLGKDRNSHPVWSYGEVVDHLRDHGLTIEDEDEADPD
jgi:predicted DNA-binding transcriptional regulator AlpA